MPPRETPPEIDAATLRRLQQICLALPEATCEPAYGHHAFKVRGKTFAWQLNDHHGDGRVALCCKAAPGVARELVGDDARRFFVPPYLGPKGWVGIYLDLDAAIAWNDLASLVTESYRLVAPKKLSASIEPPRR